MTSYRPQLLRIALALTTTVTLLWLLPRVMLASPMREHTAAATWQVHTPPPGSWLTTHTFTATATVTDTDGLTSEAAYQYAIQGLQWSPWLTQNLTLTGPLTTTRHLSITALTLPDGIHTLRYAITDAQGIMEISPVYTLSIDTHPPAPPQNPQLTPTDWQTTTDPTWTASWTNPTDTSGIATACYKLNDPPTSPQDGHCFTQTDIQRIENIRLPHEGTFDLYLWLDDVAGNHGFTQTALLPQSLLWDATPPELHVQPTGPLAPSGWYTDDIQVQIAATDTLSGIDRVQYRLQNDPWQDGDFLLITDDGIHSLTARAQDRAGNLKASQPITLARDATPPVTTLSSSLPPSPQGWYQAPVTLTLSAQDATSGVAATYWRLNQGTWQQTPTLTVAEDGQHTLAYYSIDRAGNQEPPQTTTLRIDQTPPTTSYAILASHEPVNGWYSRPVTIALVAIDEGIGVANTFYRINQGEWQEGDSFQLTESGDYDIDFYSIDKLGHEEAISSIPGGVHIDTLPPQAPIPLDVSPRGWTNQNRFALYMALPPNDLSGIAGAYVKIGDPPLFPTDGQWHPGANSILSNIQAPEEGAFNAYVWLRDTAGNADHGNYGLWSGALSLKYDATPPVTQLAIAGESGQNGWYRSPLTITLTPEDPLSGPEQTWVSVDGSEFFTSTQVTLLTQDKHVLRYFSQDHAGNQEATRSATIRIDYQAPGPPKNFRVSPTTWHATNSFTLTWENPVDLSGIFQAYYRIGSPPQSPRDGTPIPPNGEAHITVPSEGAWDVYLWLEDTAGNIDPRTAVGLSKALRYDATPPNSALTILKGDLGQEGWYISPVQILISPNDEGSGPAGVRYRVDEGPWQYAPHEALIDIQTTGIHQVDYQSVDVAGNVEPLQRFLVHMDITPPTAGYAFIDRYQRQTSFLIAWDGDDQAQGSGLTGFDLQYRDGKNGAWIVWGNGTLEKTRRFNGSYGHHYYFRIRAHDRAGNVSPWIEMPWGVYVDRLQDGDFHMGDFGVWEHGGALEQSVLRARDPDGGVSYVAQLGTPDYGPSNDISQPGHVPIGAAAITQTLHIPGPDVLDAPVLTFWYRIRTYDAAYSERYQKYYDTLDVRLKFGDELQLVFRDGQDYDAWKEHEGKRLADLGWRMAYIPIPRNMIDETISISIENWNRNDHWFNTWTQVTDIRIWEPYHTYLPQVIGGSPPSTQPSTPLDPIRSRDLPR